MVEQRYELTYLLSKKSAICVVTSLNGTANPRSNRGCTTFFGSCWINKDCKDKKIKKQDLNTYINDGWSKGRLIMKCNLKNNI